MCWGKFVWSQPNLNRYDSNRNDYGRYRKLSSNCSFLNQAESEFLAWGQWVQEEAAPSVFWPFCFGLTWKWSSEVGIPAWKHRRAWNLVLNSFWGGSDFFKSWKSSTLTFGLFRERPGYLLYHSHESSLQCTYAMTSLHGNDNFYRTLFLDFFPSNQFQFLECFLLNPSLIPLLLNPLHAKY